MRQIFNQLGFRTRAFKVAINCLIAAPQFNVQFKRPLALGTVDDANAGFQVIDKLSCSIDIVNCYLINCDAQRHWHPNHRQFDR